MTEERNIDTNTDKFFRDDLLEDERVVGSEELRECAESVYEAIMVMGQRSRTIMKEQREVLSELSSEYREQRETIFGDDEAGKLPEFPMPERIALAELMNSELEVEYEKITNVDQLR